MFNRSIYANFLLVLLAIASNSSPAVAQSLECKELIEGIRLNASGVRKYDLLVNFSTVLVGTKAQRDHSEHWVRIKYNADKQVAVHIARQVAGPSDDRKNQTSPPIVNIVSEKSVVEVVPGQNDRIRETKSFLEGMIFGNIYSIELVGVQFFPPVYTISPAGVPEIDASWALIQNRALEKGKLLDLGDELSVKIATVSSQNPNVENLSVFHFDSVGRVPVSKSLWVRSIKSDKSMGLLFERYEWFEHGGMHLPTIIHGETKKPPLPDETEFSSLDLHARFYWLSINKPLDESHFRTDYWRDPSQALNQTSPKLTQVAINPEKP